MSEPNDTPDRAAPAGKRPYKAPQVYRVELRPEESLLVNCKTGTALGPNLGCAASSCSADGS